jgi:ABC-type Fe3+ transport system permease subunit
MSIVEHLKIKKHHVNVETISCFIIIIIIIINNNNNNQSIYSNYYLLQLITMTVVTTTTTTTTTTSFGTVLLLARLAGLLDTPGRRLWIKSLNNSKGGLGS